uniref:Sucrose-phosphate synthase n=1 Tax=Araucaria cunninghamii TaxID=56994 RepID=A0A0D6QTB7_ARACU
MAGNEWINGYLEAILDSRTTLSEETRPALSLRERGNFNPTKYFVEEVVTGFDESDLHRTWLKVVAMRNTMERNNRLENMCWRIWHLARRKKQIHWDDAQRLAKRRIEREQGRRDATEDMSEDLSEGEKAEFAAQAETPKRPFSRNFSESQLWSDDNKGKHLYIVLISLHGLVRGENMELGRDSDTGGQVKYVVELARALSMMPGVYRVDLFTRQISSPDVDWSYGEPTEMLASGSYDVDGQGGGESSGAYIIRIPFGPRDKYIRKELLWPYIQEFVDGALAHILNMSRVLGEQVGGGDPVWPYVIHGHYADAGDSAALLSGALNVPMVLTGHSLGRNKLEQLLKQGRQSREDINTTYKIMRRIEAEELSLDAAELVITSTKQEIAEQWGLYDGFDVKVEKVLRARAKRGVNCHGRYMPRMVVIPPGMDFSNVIVQEPAEDGDLANLISGDGNLSPRGMPHIWSEVMRFFSNPHKPMILALSRPDPKKNITTLVKAFGECRPLRELANLTLILGNRDDLDEMSGGNAAVLITVLKLIDKYDLYGQVAYPKHHKQYDVPEIYRLAAKTKGVFINPALVEPFGLTLIEAAAHGLPMVATKNGGPVDIHRALHNGLLVDPHDQQAIADALLKLVADKNLWNECRRNGLKNIHLFSWPEHCRTYLSRVVLCRMRHPQWQTETPMDTTVEESMGDSLKDVQDMSLRLSIDGEKYSINGSVDNSGELEKLLAAKGNPELCNQVKQVLGKLKRSPLSEETERSKAEIVEPKFPINNMIVPNKYPAVRRRRKIFVIAVDCYDEDGKIAPRMLEIIQEIFKSVRADTTAAKVIGFVLSTALTVDETLAMLSLGNIQPHEFDALICSSGSELYYPTPAFPDDGSDKKLSLDADYESHIDYRWGGEGLRKTMSKLTVHEGDDTQRRYRIIFEDAEHSNAHCLSYIVKDSTKVRKVDEFRQRLRMRGLRCHLMYCRNSTQLHVIPLLASRSQALRYLFVRWGFDVANMYLFVGETGDTDYEEMLSGAHKTIILKGALDYGSEKLLRASGSYQREDIVPSDSPNIVLAEGGYNCEAILNAMMNLGHSR